MSKSTMTNATKTSGKNKNYLYSFFFKCPIRKTALRITQPGNNNNFLMLPISSNCSDCLNVLGWVVSIRIVLPYLILVFIYFPTNLKPSTPKEKIVTLM